MQAEAKRITELLNGRKRILVLSHKDADGDTLGSALAMADVLRGMGKQVAVRVPKPVPEIYDFLPGYDEVNRDGLGTADVVFAMDASNLERLADSMNGVEEGTPLVNIDHHVSNDRFGDVNLVVPEASSTAEVTYDLFNEWGAEISPGAATNLYTGILTDTGGFRHENTTHRALAIASRLVGLGAHAADIAEDVYKNKKISSLKLQAACLATMRFECDDRLVHAYVTTRMFENAGAEQEESEGLIDVLNSVDGLELAILFKEIAPYRTKVSVRSRKQANANELAARFGGGGHARAAGAEIAQPVEGAMDALLAEARKMLGCD